MNRMPLVKKFIFEDIPLYPHASFKPKPGAPPKLLLLDSDEGVVESIDLEKLSREECNELLLSRGFYKRENADDIVPEEYANGPVRKTEL